MSAANTHAHPTPPHADTARPVSRLLSLVHKLIGYGKQLAATFQQHGPFPAADTRPFGTGNLSLILASILRGLRRAEELAARIVREAASIDAPPPPRAVAAPRNPRPTQEAPRTPNAGAISAAIPTLEEITAQARGRPIGVVIADICRDLGIVPTHPLWFELSVAIVRYGGSIATVLKDVFDRVLPHTRGGAAPASAPPALAAPLVAPATGPP